MSIEISAKSIQPIRLTYGNLEERFGGKKPASRYQEAVYDVQPTANFQYRPLWDKNHDIYDKSKTAIVMEDWYSFADPRQYYYGTYTIARAKQQDVAEHNFAFVDKRESLLMKTLTSFFYKKWTTARNVLTSRISCKPYSTYYRLTTVTTPLLFIGNLALCPTLKY